MIDDKIIRIAALSRIMDTWTKQMGYPVVHVEKVDDLFLIISQSQFFMDPLATPTVPSQFGYATQLNII